MHPYNKQPPQYISPQSVFQSHRPALASRVESYEVSVGYFVFLFAHIPLALILKADSTSATLHALAVGALGAAIALTRRHDSSTLLQIVGYIVGAEVLWRATNSDVFWEYGKYATAAILGLVLLQRLRNIQWPLPLVAYFVLLLPSTAFWIGDSWQAARSEISFNLSGPFAVFVCGVYLYNHGLSSNTLRAIALFALPPILGLAAIATQSTLTAEDLYFGRSASLITSGGYGPNQVANALGLGVLICWLVLLDQNTKARQRIVFFGIMLYLLSQAMLTLSRGGVLIAFISIAVSIPLLLASQRGRRTARPILLALLVLVAVAILIPQLDDFAGGALTRRFTSLDPTHRDEIASYELRAWLDNPLVGAGPGRTGEYTTHTEFSRLLAEHGLLGVLGFFMMIWGALTRLKTRFDAIDRVWVLSMLVWALTYLMQSAIRTVAPVLLLVLLWAGNEQPNRQTHRQG